MGSVGEPIGGAGDRVAGQSETQLQPCESIPENRIDRVGALVRSPPCELKSTRRLESDAFARAEANRTRSCRGRNGSSQPTPWSCQQPTGDRRASGSATASGGRPGSPHAAPSRAAAKTKTVAGNPTSQAPKSRFIPATRPLATSAREPIRRAHGTKSRWPASRGRARPTREPSRHRSLPALRDVRRLVPLALCRRLGELLPKP